MKSEGIAKTNENYCEQMTKMIENIPENMANGEWFSALFRSFCFDADTEIGASKGGWEETEKLVRNYYNCVLKLCELAMAAFHARDPYAKEIMDLAVEPARMIIILQLAGAVSEYRGFGRVQDPLFFAALYAMKLRKGRTHPEDIVSFHRLQESDAKESSARFTGALAEVLGNKNGDLQTYLRLRYTIFFRAINGRWPTCTEIEDKAGASGGGRTWQRFRKQHGIDWLEKGKPGRKKGSANFTDNLAGSGN